jgi:phenylacetic acid degradation operon negative regulatory protein
MPRDTLAPILDDHLHGHGRLRVWSLIVTFLGDAIEPRGGRVQAARIGAILDRLGVGRAAQRTALSRLVADGWIDREKDPADGRASIYGFSGSGRAAFTPAARLVYAAPGRVTGGDWIATRSDDPRGIMIGPGVGLWPAAFPPRRHGVILRGRIETHAADADRVTPDADQHAETEAIGELAALIRDMPADHDGLDAMAARTVLVHRWRCHVLRHPEWPAALAPADWPGLRLRQRVADAYRATWPGSSRWLSCPGPGFPALPPDRGDGRFGEGAGRSGGSGSATAATDA